MRRNIRNLLTHLQLQRATGLRALDVRRHTPTKVTYRDTADKNVEWSPSSAVPTVLTVAIVKLTLKRTSTSFTMCLHFDKSASLKNKICTICVIIVFNFY